VNAAIGPGSLAALTIYVSSYYYICVPSMRKYEKHAVNEPYFYIWRTQTEKKKNPVSELKQRKYNEKSPVILFSKI